MRASSITSHLADHCHVQVLACSLSTFFLSRPKDKSTINNSSTCINYQRTLYPTRHSSNQINLSAPLIYTDENFDLIFCSLAGSSLHSFGTGDKIVEQCRYIFAIKIFRWRILSTPTHICVLGLQYLRRPFRSTTIYNILVHVKC